MKSGKHFHFKQFSIAQDKCTHKVGTDGVLLGAWADIRNARTFLDIGTGTGLIALMLAQRTDSNVHIEAIDVESEEAQQTRENAENSPWKAKIEVFHAPVQQFYPPYQYDVIVSNPPYFVNSQLPPVLKRQTARHTQSLSFIDLVKAVKRLLTPQGKFSIILPYQEGLEFIALAKTNDLFCSRQWSFKSREQKPVERWLIELSIQRPDSIEEGQIILYDATNIHHWSEDYMNLTREFYLRI